MKGGVLAHFKGDFFASVFDVEDDGAVIGVVIVEVVGVFFPFLGGKGHEVLKGYCLAIVHLKSNIIHTYIGHWSSAPTFIRKYHFPY